MTREEIEELKGLAASMGLYDDKNPCKRAVVLGKAIEALEQEPCTDTISREKALQIIRAWFDREATPSDLKNEIEQLPPVKPQYTDAEIQKMQDLEFAEIQKAYEIGKAENIEVLDKIRAEIDEQYDKVHPYDISCAEGLEMALEIIDKYKARPDFIALCADESSSEKPNKWIPVKWHEITDEEREREGYPKEWACHLDSIMPYDGQRILITTKGGYVELDECYSDDGCTFSLDSGYDWVDDVLAWCELPEPYKTSSTSCSTCILDNTDACTRGAGRAVDDEACEDYLASPTVTEGSEKE